jgi:DNA-binding XRE family transcriptional regulator
VSDTAKLTLEAVLPAIPEKVSVPKPAPEDKSFGLGDVIRQTRERRGMTQGQLAGAVGLERTSITNIERGTQRLQLNTLILVADALSMNLVIRLEPKK